MNKDSKIYIAGAHGMVGRALGRALERRGYTRLLRPGLADLDLTRQSATEAFLEKERPDVIFLAAARVGGILANSTRPAEFIYDNLAIALHVIHAAWRTGVGRLVNFGSSCIYPRQAPQPMGEDALLTGPLEPTNEAYAVAKIAAIKLCRHYHTQYGADFISLMPTNLYGPGDNYDLLGSHVLPALIRKFHLARCLATGDTSALQADLTARPVPERRSPGPAPASPAATTLLFMPNAATDPAEYAAVLEPFGIAPAAVTLWGTGAPRREFLHVDDLAAAAVHLAEHCAYADMGELVNVGCGRDLPIRELAELVRETVGFEGDIRWDSTKPDGMPRKLLDIGRIRALGWAPRIDLSAGLAATYAAYLATL